MMVINMVYDNWVYKARRKNNNDGFDTNNMLIAVSFIHDQLQMFSDSCKCHLKTFAVSHELMILLIIKQFWCEGSNYIIMYLLLGPLWL